jgi:hypothetical protein
MAAPVLHRLLARTLRKQTRKLDFREGAWPAWPGLRGLAAHAHMIPEHVGDQRDELAALDSPLAGIGVHLEWEDLLQVRPAAVGPLADHSLNVVCCVWCLKI